MSDPTTFKENIMERPATWKVVTVGVAMTGLGIVGAATASAATAPAVAAPGIEAPQFVNVNGIEFVPMGDDWTDTYWDDNWHNVGIGDWTETYWDD